MRDIAVVSFAQSKSVREDDANEVEILMPVVSGAIEQSGIPRRQIGFTMSGSCDYLAGVPFAFVSGLDAVGAWPPIRESHVEMDGAWAMHEAWTRLQHGDRDGAAALVLAAGDLAREVCERPAWIRGFDHRTEPHSIGVRDLTTSASTALAGQRAGATTGGFDVAELHAPFSHQEPILRDALGLDAGVSVNPSGGALAANVMMAAGLTRVGEAARRVIDGRAGRALAHATSGPCLQQNLVCVLEAAP